MVSLNSWSVSVALYYVSVSEHSLSCKLHSLRMSVVHSLSVSVLLEYKRTSCISITHFSTLGGIFALVLLNKGANGLCAVTIWNFGAPRR